MKKLNLLLGAACVFTLTSCGGTSEQESDLGRINNYLAECKDIVSCADAVSALKKKDFDIETYGFADEDDCFAFDFDTKQFIIMNDDSVKYAPSGYKKNSNTYHIFKLTDGYEANSVYSQYLKDSFKGCDDLYITTGIDVGSNRDIKNIHYVNTTSESKDIIIYSHCDYFTFDTSKDVISFYGAANNIFIDNLSTGVAFNTYGTAAYINVEGNGGTINIKKGSSTDVFEIVEENDISTTQEEGGTVTFAINAPNVRKSSDKEVCLIGDDQTSCSALQKLLNDETYGFYRLNTAAQDIVLGQPGEGENGQESLDITRSLILDLNGRSITFTYSNTEEIDGFQYNKAFHIHHDTTKDGQDINVIIMDSKSTLYQRSGINLCDTSIIVQGSDEEYNTNLIINSGKIHDIRHSSNYEAGVSGPAVLVIGDTSMSESKTNKTCSCTMYGGYIKSEKGINFPDKSKVSYKCIQPRGQGAVINMVYGDLESFHFCISGQGTDISSGAFDKYGGTTINITGGNLVGGTLDTSDTGTEEVPSLPYTPLFFPQGGIVNINGGNVTGPSCIDAKCGTININGGTFNATREYNENAKASMSGSSADGSVIFAEVNNGYRGKDSYPLTINIDNATMTSKNANIIKFSGYNYQSSTELATAKVTINNGTFNYKLDKYAKDDVAKGCNITCDINGGTWIKI